MYMLFYLLKTWEGEENISKKKFKKKGKTN